MRSKFTALDYLDSSLLTSMTSMLESQQKIVHNDYRKDGKVKAIRYENGVDTQYDYDSEGKILDIRIATDADPGEEFSPEECN